METKTFKIKYLGFYSSFDEKNNFISDSIKWFGNIELSENPDYVFYSVFSNEYLLYPNAVRVFFTGENIAPDFQMCDYLEIDILDFHFIMECMNTQKI